MNWKTGSGVRLPSAEHQPILARVVAEADLTVEVLLRAREFDRAATLAMKTYGPELFGFLVSILGSEGSADEVFGQVGEDLWRGLPSFAFQASFRTWFYALTRHAAFRFLRSPWNRGDRRTGSAVLDGAIANIRSGTELHRRSDIKDSFRALRESLSVEDRTLLVLRIDRNLSWEDVANVMLGDVENVNWAVMARETARLRKRFQLVKEELRKRAEAAGLIEKRT